MAKGNRREQIKGNLKGGKNKGRPKAPPSLTAPLTTPQAKHMAAAEAKAEYGPTIRGAEGMRRGSVERQKNIGQMFQGLGNQINESAAATDASYGQANAALLAHMQAGQQAAAQSQGQIAQSNTDLVALTGADPSLTTPALAEGAAAAGQRDIAAAALAAPIAQAGAAQAGFLRNTGINARREGISQKLGEAKRRDTIKEDLTALRKEEAQKQVGNFREIRGEERDHKIQLRAFPEAEKDRQLQREEGDANREIDWYNAKTGRQNSGGGEGGRTPAEEQERKEDWRGAMSAGKNLITANGVPKSPQEWAGLQALLEDKSEITPQQAAQVVKRLKTQYAGSGAVRGAAKNAAPGW